MNVSNLLHPVKSYLRIQHTYLDYDICLTINECLRDLEICGIKIYKIDGKIDGVVKDPLICNAVKLFCKAAFTDDTDKAAAYLARYDALKGSLMMAGDYQEEQKSE